MGERGEGTRNLEKGESIRGKGGGERDGGVRGEAIPNPHSHSDPGKGVLRRSTLLCLPLIRGGFWCFVGQAVRLIVPVSLKSALLRDFWCFAGRVVWFIVRVSSDCECSVESQ